MLSPIRFCQKTNIELRKNRKFLQSIHTLSTYIKTAITSFQQSQVYSVQMLLISQRSSRAGFSTQFSIVPSEILFTKMELSRIRQHSFNSFSRLTFLISMGKIYGCLVFPFCLPNKCEIII